MAKGTYTVSSVSSRIHTHYNGALAHTLLEKSAAIARLNELGKVRYGVKVVRHSWPAVSDPHEDAHNIPDGGPIPDASREEITKAYLDWAIYIEAIRVGRILQNTAKNPEEFFMTAEGADALASEMNRVIPKIARTINSDIISLSANAANKVISLGSAIGSNSNTYGGIARTGNAWWQPYVDSNSGTNRSVTRTIMETAYDNLNENRESQTSEVWAGTTAFNAIRTLINTIYPGRNTNPEVMKAGASMIYWENLPIIRMPGMDANATYWLDFDSDDGIELLFQHDDDFLIKEEPGNSYDTRWSVAAHACLKVANPWKQGSVQDLQ